MKWLAKFAACSGLLLFLVVPVMACLTPDAQLTREEKECCRKMAGDCGDMGMDSSHSCCTQVQHSENSYLAASAFHVNAAAMVCAAAPLVLSGIPEAAAAPTDFQIFHSPPGLRAFQILRI
jgi:hypothetical protein